MVFSFDGENFVEFPQSTHPHMNIAKIGIYKEMPFAVSGNNGVAKTEILNSGEWSDRQDYPFAKA